MEVDLIGHLKQRLKDARTYLPLAPGGYIRASSLARVCPREEVLIAEQGLVRTGVETASDALTYAHGHGLHYALQNHILPAAGVLVGRWACLDCGANYGVPSEAMPIRVEDGVHPPVLEGVLVPRPEVCARCGGTDFHYRELSFSAPEYGTGGHPDGFLTLPGREGLGLLEAKSTSLAWEVKHAPYVAHAIQVQMYLWFTGLQWGLILYWNKLGEGPSALIQHVVERDDETIAAIQATLRSIWKGLEGGPLPARICYRNDAPRARDCPVAGVCFERLDRPEPPPVDETDRAGFDEAAAGAIF